MSRPRRAATMFATSVVILAAVVGTRFAVDWWVQEPPNYTLIEDGLYLGGSVPQPPAGTTAVLNLCETADTYEAPTHHFEPIVDAAPAPSLDWLRRQVAFVKEHRMAGDITFVHCRNGISRSAMVVAAYLMADRGWGRDVALAFLRSKRPGVRPNPAFLALLAEWEQALKDPPALAQPTHE